MQIHRLLLHNTPIFEQLQIEEAFLRTSDMNLIIINQGSPETIVLGIKESMEEAINHSYPSSAVPIVRRASGGGSVLVDHNTFFISFIFNAADLSIPLFPEAIDRWAYQHLQWIPDLELVEHDLVLNQKKIGGTAQYIQRQRFLYHASLLWKYSPNMDLLALPKRQPTYRQQRSHHQFLGSLETIFSSLEAMQDHCLHYLDTQWTILPISHEAVFLQCTYPHRKATHLIKR